MLAVIPKYQTHCPCVLIPLPGIHPQMLKLVYSNSIQFFFPANFGYRRKRDTLFGVSVNLSGNFLSEQQP